jgi:hypothetical protein
MAMTDLLGKTQVSVKLTNYQILDTIYSNAAVILNNAAEVLLKQSATSVYNIPVPLVGFSYKPMGTIELLKYEYSEYPYLSKQMVSNAGVKQATRFTVQVIDAIASSNIVLEAIAKRQLLQTMLDKYAAAGGLFTVLTLWGTITNCLLEGMEGVEGQSTGSDGVLFNIHFYKPNFDTAATTDKLSSSLSSLTSGGAGSIK